MAGTRPFSCMHGLGGIPETRLKVSPDVNWVRRDPGTGGDCEDPATLEEGNTVSKTRSQVIEVVETPAAGPKLMAA